MLFLLVLSELIIYALIGSIFGLFEKLNFKRKKDKIFYTLFCIFSYDCIPRYIFYTIILNEKDLQLPTITYFLINYLQYIILLDLSFWIIHVIIHMEPFYTLIHVKHHSVLETMTFGIFGKYMDLYDFIIFMILTMPLKILFFGNCIISMILVDIIDYIGTIYSHSKLFHKHNHHILHHKYPNNNFGILPISDTLFGTAYK